MKKAYVAPAVIEQRNFAFETKKSGKPNNGNGHGRGRGKGHGRGGKGHGKPHFPFF